MNTQDLAKLGMAFALMRTQKLLVSYGKACCVDCGRGLLRDASEYRVANGYVFVVRGQVAELERNQTLQIWYGDTIKVGTLVFSMLEKAGLRVTCPESTLHYLNLDLS